MKNSLPTSISNLILDDSFNTDNFGLNYQCLRNKINHLFRENFLRGKKNKISITVMTATSATGEV